MRAEESDPTMDQVVDQSAVEIGLSRFDRRKEPSPARRIDEIGSSLLAGDEASMQILTGYEDGLEESPREEEPV